MSNEPLWVLEEYIGSKNGADLLEEKVGYEFVVTRAVEQHKKLKQAYENL